MERYAGKSTVLYINGQSSQTNLTLVLVIHSHAHPPFPHNTCMYQSSYFCLKTSSPLHCKWQRETFHIPHQTHCHAPEKKDKSNHITKIVHESCQILFVRKCASISSIVYWKRPHPSPKHERNRSSILICINSPNHQEVVVVLVWLSRTASDWNVLASIWDVLERGGPIFSKHHQTAELLEVEQTYCPVMNMCVLCVYVCVYVCVCMCVCLNSQGKLKDIITFSSIIPLDTERHRLKGDNAKPKVTEEKKKQKKRE